MDKGGGVRNEGRENAVISYVWDADTEYVLLGLM